jgi:hypothetical protein
MHHILSRADITYLGLPRFVHLATCLSDGHGDASASPLSQTVSRADQASVEQAQPATAAQPDHPVSLLLQALQELIANGALGVNIPGGGRELAQSLAGATQCIPIHPCGGKVNPTSGRVSPCVSKPIPSDVL